MTEILRLEPQEEEIVTELLEMLWFVYESDVITFNTYNFLYKLLFNYQIKYKYKWEVIPFQHFILIFPTS